MGFEPTTPWGNHFLGGLMLNHHGYILEEESHYLLPKTGGGARPMCVSPPKRHVQSFPFPVHMKAEVMFT